VGVLPGERFPATDTGFLLLDDTLIIEAVV
jgi:hypothetical protein